MKLSARSIMSVVLLATIAAVAIGVIVVTRNDTDAAPATAPAVTKQVAVERGDITVSESVDGTVEETDTVTVVHRIEGQVSSTLSNQVDTASTPDDPTDPNDVPATGGVSATPAGLMSLDATNTTATTPTVGSDTSIIEASFLTSTDPPADTTTPPATAPTDGATDTTAPPETTTPPTPTVPTTTTPTDPAPEATPPTGGNPPGGGLQPGGLSAPAGGAGTGAAAASNDPVGQMITGLAAVGTPIGSGDVLYTVEGQPVVALSGALPAWRTMNRSSDDGADIAQLEAALVALGYDPDGDVTVDATWDSDTTAMVKRWQQGIGTDDTAEVTLGSVVFIPHSGAVASTSVAVRDDVYDGDTVLALTGSVQLVIIEVPTELQADIAPSMRVDIAGTPGTVTRLRSADTDNGVTVQAVISPDTALDLEAGATVKVTISYNLATDQLVVPTDAVVSRRDGTYAVQTLDDTTNHAFVAVEIVAVSGNRTAITGDGLTESTTVLAPS
jgi:hypothetical protein